MLLMVNVDNITGDALPYLIDTLFEYGAKNVNATTAITKKGRLGYLFFIDTQPEFADAIMDFLAHEVGTLGVRILESEHRKYDYRFQKARLVAPAGQAGGSPLEIWVTVKLVLDDDGEPVSARAEYRELEAALRSLRDLGRPVSMAELRALVELAVLRERRASLSEIRVDVQPEEPARRPENGAASSHG